MKFRTPTGSFVFLGMFWQLGCVQLNLPVSVDRVRKSGCSLPVTGFLYFR